MAKKGLPVDQCVYEVDVPERIEVRQLFLAKAKRCKLNGPVLKESYGVEVVLFYGGPHKWSRVLHICDDEAISLVEQLTVLYPEE